MFLISLRENTYQRCFYQSSYEFLDIDLEDHLKQPLRGIPYILQTKEGTEEVDRVLHM